MILKVCSDLRNVMILFYNSVNGREDLCSQEYKLQRTRAIILTILFISGYIIN